MHLATCDVVSGSPNSSLTSLAPSLALLTHNSGSSKEEDDDREGEQAPRTFSSIDERIEEEDVSSSFTKFIAEGGVPRDLARSRCPSNPNLNGVGMYVQDTRSFFVRSS